jgi:hypothetical protein
MTGAAKYPIHTDVLNSAALKAVFSTKGSYLLPQAYRKRLWAKTGLPETTPDCQSVTRHLKHNTRTSDAAAV